MLSAVAARRAAKAAQLSGDLGIDAVQSSLRPAAPPAAVPELGSSSEDEPAIPSPTSSPESPKKRKRKPIPEQKPRKKRKPSPVDGIDDETRPAFPQYTPRERAYSPAAPVGLGDDLDGTMDVQFGMDEEDDVLSEVDELPEPAPIRPQRPALSYLPASTFLPSSSSLLELPPSALPPLNLKCDTPAILLALKGGETLAFVGTCRLLVVKGKLELFGTVLEVDRECTTHEIYAPKSHTIPVLTALTSSKSSRTLPLPPDLENQTATADALVVLQELHSNIEGLGRIVTPFSGAFSPPSPSSTADWGLAGFYPLTSNTPLHGFVLPPSWEGAINAFLPSESDTTEDRLRGRVALVRGVKNSGKSTFARSLLNRLTSRYQQVVYLELDPGQTEFTAPGLLSLHVLSRPVLGPSFSHPLPPYRAHYLGSSSPKSDPALYLTAVEALLQSFRLELQFPSAMEVGDGRVSDVVPLVVNTMGWTKGLGARLLEQVEQLVQPTHVFEFPDSGETAHPLDRFSSSTLTPTGNRDDRQVYTLEPVQPSPRLSAYNAPLLRALSTMSYLHSHPPQEGQSTRWSTTPLCAQLPYEVDLRTTFDKIVLLGPGSEDVVPEELGTVLNGSLVTFLAVDDGSEPLPAHDGHLMPYEQRAPAPSPFTSHCLGLGVIRSFNRESGKALVLTPVPLSTLPKARVLVKGELELPIWAFLDPRQEEEQSGVAGVEWERVPYLEFGGVRGVGVLHSVGSLSTSLHLGRTSGPRADVAGIERLGPEIIVGRLLARFGTERT
ncbi:hypothetical protein DACRYDRAFT_12792 [Dacryopinax primogenitus]|uniref:Polynucleotide 5'-hydroxyl-kinase GRC3 n=1 Tax=Dacryopinax primogenitus (strain DJM 731) TaxID=1858805 RepID=M5G6T8_DACPD|nr:uncharacterized protein DACRYDRAFT_12792 [Dacryopinax primogenitus]EJU05971.1 hypothetical protein DACRYDRAFT_12792 [Dacryopinax primogenitus]